MNGAHELTLYVFYNYSEIIEYVGCFILNLRGKMKKLQTAIIQTGLVIKINQNQFYSAEQNRMITFFCVYTPVTYYSERKKSWKTKDYEILKTCSMIDVILCLLDIYKAVSVCRKN